MPLNLDTPASAPGNRCAPWLNLVQGAGSDAILPASDTRLNRRNCGSITDGHRERSHIMMDEQRALTAHLLRRAGFGATPQELDEYLEIGYEATVEKLLHP